MSARLTCSLGPDSDGGLLLDVVATAGPRLDLAVYELGPGWAAVLRHAALGGTAVCCVVDEHHGPTTFAAPVLGGHVRLRAAGGAVGAAMHAKLMLAGPRSRPVIWVGTGNLVDRDAPRVPLGGPARPGTREWAVVVSGAPGLASEAQRIFGGILRRSHALRVAARRTVAAPPPVRITVPVQPPLGLDVDEARLSLVAGGGACGQRLLALLGRARRRVDVAVPYVHPGAAPVAALLDRLEERAAAGVGVRMLLGAPEDGATGGSGSADAALAALRRRGVDARRVDPSRVTALHVKGAVADDAVALGSPNWSRSGLGDNLETLLVVDHGAAADYFAAAFERDWEASSGAV